MSGERTPGEPLRLERLLGVLPDSEALRPLEDLLIRGSVPDPTRRWTASGELGTAGARLVDPDAFEEGARAWVAAETERLERRARRVVALTRALAAGEQGEVIAQLLDESGSLERDGAAAEAGRWAEAAYRLAHERGHPRAAEALRRAARCARSVGDLGRATAGYEQAWVRARDEGHRVDAVIAATGRGNVAVDRGQWTEAEHWYALALGLLGDPDGEPVPSDEASGLRWRIFQNLGITHRERGALEEAETWYRRAEREAAAQDDRDADVEIENGRGQLDLARGSARSAELRFRRALDALSEDGSSSIRVAIRSNLAQALLAQGRALEAGSVAREAEAEALRGALGRLPEVYRVLARIVEARGEAEAFVFLDRALDVVRTVGLPPHEEALTLLEYAGLREREGEAEAALEARTRAERIMAEHTREQPTRDGGAS
jgi:tetratricopeptide (TPR) repeat protein